MNKLQACNSYLLAVPFVGESIHRSGIILLKEEGAKHQISEVIDVGPNVSPSHFKKGDIIAYYLIKGAFPFMFEGEEYNLVPEDMVLAKVVSVPAIPELGLDTFNTGSIASYINEIVKENDVDLDSQSFSV